MTEKATRREATPPVSFPDVFPGRTFVTTGEVARAFGYTTEHVRREVRKGRLLAVGVGRAQRIAVESVRSWMGTMWRERLGETVPENPEKL